MAGIFGVVSKENCVEDLFLGTFYLQHRAQDYCGLALYDGEKLNVSTHRGLVRQQFPKEKRMGLGGYSGVGSVAGDRQPVSELMISGGMILAFDGNVINYESLKESLLIEGVSFSGYKSPEEVSDAVLISKIIARESDFVSGIKTLAKVMKGDFAIVALTSKGVYAARGWGRKPLVLDSNNKIAELFDDVVPIAIL